MLICSLSICPYSLLHKKLRESNVSLRRSIVERVLKLYHTTSRNLTIVNDNLSRAQGIVEVRETKSLNESRREEENEREREREREEGGRKN